MIKNLTNDIGVELKKSLQSPVKGFLEIEKKRRNLRNLLNYNLYQINDMF